MDKCNCYHEYYNRPECWGTKEREPCSCGGDETKCNFYPEKRTAAHKRARLNTFGKEAERCYMNKTDVLTGRIVQRVIDAKAVSSRVVIKHGVDYHHDINKLIDNLFELFPGSLIAIKKLNFGYELRIEVDF